MANKKPKKKKKARKKKGKKLPTAEALCKKIDEETLKAKMREISIDMAEHIASHVADLNCASSSLIRIHNNTVHERFHEVPEHFISVLSDAIENSAELFTRLRDARNEYWLIENSQ